jgi:phytanoyl-CoA hydroxylase
MTRDAYVEQGYWLAKGLLRPDALGGVLADMRRVFALHAGPADEDIFALAARDFQTYRQCARLCQQLPSLHRLGVGDAMLGAVRGLGLEFPAINIRPFLFVSHRRLAKHAFYWKTDPHQDWMGMRGSLDGVVAWANLAPMTPDVGFLEVIPGSHVEGFRQHAPFGPNYHVPDADATRFRPIPMEVGDVLFFSAFTLHRSGNNTSERIRWAINFRYDNILEPTFRDRKYPPPFEYTPNHPPLPPGFPSRDQIAAAIRRGGPTPAASGPGVQEHSGGSGAER